ncbi:MAG: AAA domain-containing protein [Planctomycetota bacterium]
MTNEPTAVLSAWTALEVLSPQTYRVPSDLAAGQESRIDRLAGARLPWERGLRSIPKNKLYHELVLGAIEMGPATDRLLDTYADDRPEPYRGSGWCPLATVMLDREGRPCLDDTSVTIASFAWALPVSLKGNLRALADWPAEEKKLLGWFRKALFSRCDTAGNPLPLTQERIDELFEALVRRLDLGHHPMDRPSFAVRRYEWMFSRTPPESTLLNSFFLEDLGEAQRLAAREKLPNALSHYLRAKGSAEQVDLLNDEAGLRRLLQPALTPLGRWPGRGGFALSLLQQAAVNATDPAEMGTGVLGVNGPPGTGKTTLLRDVVAARVVERASVMSTYERPADAFQPTSVTAKRDGATLTFHRLDDRLKGFEMVVASSNNKAVENVSAELPGLDAVADDDERLRYFESIADHVFQREGGSWGMIAAVLGNQDNRYRFVQSFWKDDDRGLSTYLNHVTGQPQTQLKASPDGPPVATEPTVIQRENPPANPREALARWKEAKHRFVSVQQQTDKMRTCRQAMHEQLERLDAARLKAEREARLLIEREADAAKQRCQIEPAGVVAKDAEYERDMAFDDLQAKRLCRPSWFARCLRTKRFRQWLAAFHEVTRQHEEAQFCYAQAREELDRALADAQAADDRLNDTQNALIQARQEATTCREAIDRFKRESGVQLPDQDFFEQPHESRQIASVWFDRADEHLREDLFTAAVDLHRAFVDAAAVPLRQNLALFFPWCGSRSLGTPEKDALLPELWASFFLVVPVVSTTFASVRRMFGLLKPGTLGWLLVDEAGQAVPQAAVGAMMRCQRSVLVGDPLQIQPVVTLSGRLTREVCLHCGIDEAEFNAPSASAQTMADMASRYGATFPAGSGQRAVGAPLLVHRRCESPMFEIANHVAYAGMMVQAKRASTEPRPLGSSRWIDVASGRIDGKWCPEEGDVLIDLLRRLRAEERPADLYVVTPFRSVRRHLQTAIRDGRVLNGWVPDPGAWLQERIGTVHTVQGREAETVFFVLGASDASQNGARQWAGRNPNLLNVAVTRAQRSLYVIGNRHLWRNAGYFAMLDRIFTKS